MSLRVFLATLLLVSSVSAEPKVEAIPAGEDVIVPVQKGQAVPFSGQLYDPSTALRWANWLIQYRFLLEQERAVGEKRCSVEIDYRDSLLTIEKERAFKAEEAFQKSLDDTKVALVEAQTALQDPPWYSTMEFGLAVGTVTATALLVVAIAVVGSVE